MIVAKIRLGAIVCAIRTARLRRGCKLSAISFKHGDSWYSGAH